MSHSYLSLNISNLREAVASGDINQQHVKKYEKYIKSECNKVLRIKVNHLGVCMSVESSS